MCVCVCVFKEKRKKLRKNDRLERPNCITQTRKKNEREREIHDKKRAHVCTQQ
jgi:hypothetical protein